MERAQQSKHQPIKQLFPFVFLAAERHRQWPQGNHSNVYSTDMITSETGRQKVSRNQNLDTVV